MSEAPFQVGADSTMYMYHLGVESEPIIVTITNQGTHHVRAWNI
jgi:hypothetical protein